MAPPDESARAEILRLKLRSVRCDFNVEGTAEQLQDYSGAEVEAVALDAVRLMVRQLDDSVNAEHIECAIGLGEERRRIIRNSQA